MWFNGYFLSSSSDVGKHAKISKQVIEYRNFWKYSSWSSQIVATSHSYIITNGIYLPGYLQISSMSSMKYRKASTYVYERHFS